MKKPTFVYPIYIATTPEKLWDALTSGEFTKKYHFGCQIKSSFQEGATVTYLLENGRITNHGNVLKCEPLHLLSFTWNTTGDETPREDPTRVTFQLQSMDDSTVKLTLTHEELLETDFVYGDNTFKGINNGWPAILCNLKSLLETGRTLPPIFVDRVN
ncbi:SRPBCC family protein [Peribacillus simplex]|uniref:SRPBCC family protein n=1 Tax=Peribacillus simplex TaxID=1478 RepID=UPI00298E6680|nr:SRPBCC family protein [Peribacillus simplex]MDW7615951.1 SRPBCC family protein [Peribacillus simplex]